MLGNRSRSAARFLRSRHRHQNGLRAKKEKKKEGEEAKVQEGTDGVGKHFFLDVLSEDGRKRSSGREDLTRSAREGSRPMKNHARASLRNIPRLTVVPKTAKAD